MRIEDYKYWVSFRYDFCRRIKRYKTIKGVIRAFDKYRANVVEDTVVRDVIIFKKIAQVENSGLDKVLLLKELEKEIGE